ELMRRYLRGADFVGGYIPQLAMEPRASELWTLFWFSVRRIDDIVDSAGPEAVHPLIGEIRAGRGSMDFQQAMLAFVHIAKSEMDSGRRANEMLDWVEAEARYRRLGTDATAEDLFLLWYHKAYIPAYVGMRLLLRDESEEQVRTLAKLL